MADTTALKNRIRAAIKANDNQEITGPVLQQALLDIVDELDLNPELENEAQQRQNGDSTLQQNITNEAVARGNADTAMQGLIDGITDNIENGYVYAGIATPSSTPATGKVFYLALIAGTYINFGNTVITQGINILKYNGSAWSLDTFIGIDDTPTPNSPNLVKSGGAWQTPKFLFAENCPWIKEMYINQEGISAGLGNIHNIYSDHLTFSNTEATALVGITALSENNGINCIYYFNGSYTDNTRILGYIIVDWANIPLYQPIVNKINDIAKNLIFSPSIAEMLLAKSVKPVQELGYSVDKNVSQKTITENLNVILTDLIGSKQEAVATTYPLSSASNTSYIWFIIPNQRLSKINKIKFLAKVGTINFYKVKYDGVNVPTKEDVASVVVNSLQESSVITIDVDVNLASDEYIGVNGAFWFGDIAGNTTRNWELSTNIVSNESTQYLFVNAYYEDVNAEIAEVKNKIDDNTNKVVMYSTTLDSENVDIVGTQLIVDGALRVGSSLLYLNKFYSLGIRTFRAVCKFNANTIANFVTVYYGTHNTGEYTNNIVVNISQKTIGCGSGEVVYCPLLVNYNHEFIIDITKYFQHNIVKITDLYSGAEWEYIWTYNGTGGVGGGAIGTRLDTGMAWDLYGFYTSGGSTFDIKKIEVLGKKAGVVFYGDSITEPEAYWPHNIFTKSWTQLLYKKSNGRIVSSGRSGTGIDSLLDRMQAELPYLKPKAVFITIGTNGGVSYSSLETVVNYIRSLDIVPYVNHIPANINSGGVSNHAGVNAIVDQIRTQMNVKGIDFDKPTSVDYAGENVNTAMMWWEEYASPDGNIYHHPNELGSAAMVARVDVDVPEIYSIGQSEDNVSGNLGLKENIQKTEIDTYSQCTINKEDGELVSVTQIGYLVKEWIISEHNQYFASGRQVDNEKRVSIAYYDSEYNYIGYEKEGGSAQNFSNYELTIPTGAHYVRVVGRSGSPFQEPVLEEIKYLTDYKLNEIVNTNPLDGKIIAIIGGSIDTHGNSGDNPNAVEMKITEKDVGVELSAYVTYYDVQAGLSLGGTTYTSEDIGTEVTFVPTSEDVGKVIGLPKNHNNNNLKVWWSYVQEKFNCDIIPVCWSGSGNTRNRLIGDSDIQFSCSYSWHESQIRKCGIRIPGTMNRKSPDIIIVSRSVNDLTHTPYAVVTQGYYDTVDWQYPTDEMVNNGQDYGYLEGISVLVKKLREAYPYAEIIFRTTTPYKRNNYSHFPANNGSVNNCQVVNLTKQTADFFGCKIIDSAKCGITFENLSNYSSDGTHPNAKGHEIIGKHAIRELQNMNFDMIK